MKKQLNILVNKDYVLKMLDCNKNNENYNYYVQIYNEILTLAKSIAVPTLYYDYSNENFNINILNTCKETCFCLVTLGEKIDLKIAEFFESYDYLKAMMLNSIGDNILFNATKQINKVLSEIDKKKISIRRSPGAIDFSNEFQNLIIKSLKKSLDINIEISSGYMIKPQKSLTYIYGLDGILKFDENKFHDCDSCILKECKYKNDNYYQ